MSKRRKAAKLSTTQAASLSAVGESLRDQHFDKSPPATGLLFISGCNDSSANCILIPLDPLRGQLVCSKANQSFCLALRNHLGRGELQIIVPLLQLAAIQELPKLK